VHLLHQHELTDGLKTDVDCGGATCEKRCGLDSPCAADGDCATGKVDGETLRCRALNNAELCADGAQANMESDVDCGGAVCAPTGCTCAVGFTCALGSDCTSAVCDATTLNCISYDDGVQNGDETDLDCGGPDCNKCGTAARARAPRTASRSSAPSTRRRG
jgi:hypothetical protein